VLRVSAPRDLDEGSGCSDDIVTAARLKHIVEVMGIALAIGPRDLASGASGFAFSLGVKEQPKIPRDGLKDWAKSALQRVADDLPKSVRR
jgi:hypothetical protein